MNPKTAQDCIHSADELYEVLMLTTQDKTFEVLQLTHNYEVSWLVVEYQFDKELCMGEQKRTPIHIVQAEYLKSAADARVRVMELVMQADLSA
jgi:hypothetical protein